MNLFTKQKQSHRHRKQTYGSLWLLKTSFLALLVMKTKRAIDLWRLRARSRARAQKLRKDLLPGPALHWHDPEGECHLIFCPLGGTSPAQVLPVSA